MKHKVWRLIRIYWKKLLLLRGDNRTIARGIALGIAANFIPTVGLGPPLVFWLAGIIRGHKAAAVISTIGIKVSIPLLYFLNYATGTLILDRSFKLNHHFDWDLTWIMSAGINFFLGMAINFSMAFVSSYYLSLYWLEKRKPGIYGKTKGT